VKLFAGEGAPRCGRAISFAFALAVRAPVARVSEAHPGTVTPKPGCASLTRATTPEIKMGSSFRWNDGEVWRRHRSTDALRAWVPAFAGMTVTLLTGDVARP